MAVDLEVANLAAEFVAGVQTGRAVKAVRAMLEHGFVTTDDLKALGYEHPPRAIADVRDQGIPVTMEMVRSTSGRRMARYCLGTAQNIREGQAGRTSFSKKFRSALRERYGDVDTITGAIHDPRALQVDHRVPFRISGDAGLNQVDAFMLLDGKSQRAKSWSCEHCRNYTELRDPSICRTCSGPILKSISTSQWSPSGVPTSCGQATRSRIIIGWRSGPARWVFRLPNFLSS